MKIHELLCFAVFPYSLAAISLRISPLVLGKADIVQWDWHIWLNKSYEPHRNCISNKTKQSATEPCVYFGVCITLRWRHNGRDSVSNHQPHHCLLNRLFRRSSKKYQSSASLAFVRGIHRWPVKSPHKGTVTRKMFPFHDVIMWTHMNCISTNTKQSTAKLFVESIDRIYTFPQKLCIFILEQWRLVTPSWQFMEHKVGRH